MTRIHEQVAAIPKGPSLADLETLRGRVAGFDAGLGALDRTLDGLRAVVASLRSPVGKASLSNLVEASARRAAHDVKGARNAQDAAMGWGTELFLRGKYLEALEFLERLQANHPDDARVWYYSALAQCFTNREWLGQAERLAEKGIACERTGNPGTPRIDIAFTSLTVASGKDWLGAYRRRVGRDSADVQDADPAVKTVRRGPGRSAG